MSRESSQRPQITSETLESALKTEFGYSEFRGDQKEILLEICAQKSALVLMPTGMGKSLCYQLPAKLLREPGSLVLVISPLIALMQDQVEKARALGLSLIHI